MGFPLGYHITWGTYGARLHGSDKPHVDRDHNEFGAPFPPADPEREERMRRAMKESAVRLTFAQRKVVEDSVRDVSERYGWMVHAIAPQGDHVHVVIAAPREGDALRDALKAVASRALNARFGRRTWWAENGSTKFLWDESYFASAIRYVRAQKDF